MSFSRLVKNIWFLISSNDKQQYLGLRNHQFFSSLRYWINMEIDNIPIHNEIKKRVICKFLKIHFITFEKNFSNFINNMEDLDPSELENVFLKSIHEYEEEALRKSIPVLFVDKFRHWHSDHVSIAFEAIKSIKTSTFYDSPEKVAAVLDILLFTFRLTIVDAEKTINDLNGELETILQGTIFDT